MARPTLIDERDGPCELCAAHQNGKCDRCRKSIPVYENMGGSGFQSVQPSHYHQQADKRHSFWAELCVDCYAKDRVENYPGEAKKMDKFVERANQFVASNKEQPEAKRAAKKAPKKHR